MRILLVEDEQVLSGFLKKTLEAECFAIDVVADGEQGSYLARTNSYDLLILDNMLPKKTGLEICREVRAAGIATPILALSVRSETHTKIEMLDAGADDYLIKPFSLQELVARIRALLRRPQKILDDTLVLDTLVLDTNRREAYHDGERIPLTRKEYSMLELLMRNKGTVLSRGMIIEHVWDMTADPFSNTIESHVLSLRKKIDAGRARKLIHTVQGIGYRMEIEEMPDGGTI